MNVIVPRNADHVIGVLSGGDRLVFRGTLRMLAFARGMAAYLSLVGTLLKDFGTGKIVLGRYWENFLTSNAALMVDLYAAGVTIEGMSSDKVRRGFPTYGGK